MYPGDVLILGVLVALFAYPRFAMWLDRRVQGRDRRPVGRRKEKAAALLKEQGYRVWGAPKVPLILRVDGRPHTAYVEPDLVAERGLRRYAVEIQSAERGEKLSSRQTRRRLLEYVWACEPDGLLIVDLERERVRRIEVRIGRSPGSWRWRGRPWMVPASTGAALAYLFFRWTG